MSNKVTFEEFKSVWLEDVIAGNPSSVELGNRFSRKLITQWKDIDDSSDDIIFCDGAGDGGIDIAYLNRGDTDDDGSMSSDTWYLVQANMVTPLLVLRQFSQKQ